MSKNFTKHKFVLECLQSDAAKNGEGLEASKIGEWIIDSYPNICHKKADASIVANKDTFFNHAGALNKETFKWTIAAEITAGYPPKDYKKKSPPKWFRDGVRFHNTTPRLFYFAKVKENYEDEWENLTSSFNINTNTKNNTSHKDDKEYDGDEESLYPKLGDFLYSEYEILSRKIDHRNSRKGIQGDNKWLFPDVVGLEKLGENFDNEIRELSDKKFKLWSFEVKKDLTRSQAREAYFQAVSNCSWANFGYLVTTELKGDAKDELEILANRYGIGVIQLNPLVPAESNIIILAKENYSIDWNIANRMAQISNDFKEYIESIIFYTKNYHDKKRAIRKDDWFLITSNTDEE